MILLHFRKAFIFALMGFFFAGCATERGVEPTISQPAREGLDVDPPVIGSVFDARSESSVEDVSDKLQDELQKVYGSSIEWAGYFDNVPEGRVAVRIRIVELGASFGSRIVSTSRFVDSVETAQLHATGPWGPTVANVSGQQAVRTSQFSGEGWWNGAAWIDLEVYDNRESSARYFTLPIVAEHQESNVLGYASGDKAGRKAWKKASAQLTRALDSILRVVRD